MESYWNEIERMFVLKESSVCIYLAMIYINKWTYETRYSIPINGMYPNHFQESIWHILKHVAKYNLLFVFWRGFHYLVWKANTEKNHPPPPPIEFINGFREQNVINISYVWSYTIIISHFAKVPVLWLSIVWRTFSSIMYTCFFKFHIDFRQAQPLYYILQKKHTRLDHSFFCKWFTTSRYFIHN